MRRLRNISPSVLGALAVVFLAVPFARARVESEIVPSEKRKVTVDKAAALAKTPRPEMLPETLPLPYAPPGFDLTDAEEAAAAAAAARLANAGNPGAVLPPNEHQLLEEIAAKVQPSGTFSMGGKPLLFFGKKFVKIGNHFTVTYKGIDYDLELTQIDGTNFTLKYKTDEITRPIKPPAAGKSP